MGREGKLLLLRMFLIGAIVNFTILSTLAQFTHKGQVIDEASHKPVSGASIFIKGGNIGTSTDAKGQFSVTSDSSSLILIIKAIGYSSLEAAVLPQDTMLTLYLKPDQNEIEVVDVFRKRKYSNRNNPAVELIDLVIRNKGKNRLSGKDSLYFKQYEKIKFGLVDPPSSAKNRLGNLSFFFQNVDTSVVAGKELLTLYMEENISDNYVKQNPSRQKKIIRAQEKTEFDTRYINNPNMQSYMNYLFQPVDIYDESIFFLNKLFLSPIADNGKIYYKYYILDTVRTAKEPYVRLAFEPRNSTDLLLRGELQVSLDGRYAVKQANMSVGANTNVNWVNEFTIRLAYSPDRDGIMLQDTAMVRVLFGRGKTDAVFGERLSVNEDYNSRMSLPDGLFTGAPIETKLDANSIVGQDRPVALNPVEQRTYSNVDSVNNLKSFKTLLSIGYLFSQSYYSLGKVELGPLEYAYHQNNLEGNRFRLGGRTTEAFSDKMYLEGYLAYGTRDDAWKYFLRTAVSLNGKSIATFPAHYIEGIVQHDVFDPGRGIGFLKGDSFFQGFRTNRPLKWLGSDAYRLGHLVEFGNHISLSTNLTHQRRVPLGDLRFPLAIDTTQFLDQIHTNDVQLTLRWAPFEKFYYRNLRRTTVVEKYPIFSLQYNRGLKGFWDVPYTYDALRFFVSKRWFLNQLGFGDMTFSVGKIWGELPYPLLEMPNVQEIKDRHTISYELTNNMEFVADQFIKFSYDHQLQGFIFNKLPLIKKLKLREVFGAKMFYGDLSTSNNPYDGVGGVYFDNDEEGNAMTHVLGKNPYWEGYVGIDNILKIVKVEYIKRLNYLDHASINKERFRVSLHFDF
ncbi:membrane protein [Sphingobacterium alkalisoli]|nr:DUF5686 and carboxypeptidase-like regulatory domain-containing protein [Sphingobacterium alkalisoli]GGH30937.1 membrane protein [Sphingobacterium alkalisoli]